MGIQTGNGNARCAYRARLKEICKQKTDSHDLRLLKRAWNFAERNVRCDQRDRDLSAGQTHRAIFDAAPISETFGLPWEFETGFVHPRFVNRSGHDGIELAASRERDRFFER